MTTLKSNLSNQHSGVGPHTCRGSKAVEFTFLQYNSTAHSGVAILEQKKRLRYARCYAT